MSQDGVLVLEPDKAMRRAIRDALRNEPLTVHASGSVADALEWAQRASVSAFIADYTALVRECPTTRPFELKKYVGEVIRRLRDSQSGRRMRSVLRYRLSVIITSPPEDINLRASVYDAGADLVLSAAEAKNARILHHHLERLLPERGEMSAGVVPASTSSVPEASTPDVRPVPGDVQRVMDVFSLPTAHLRGESGRLHAGRIAETAGLPLKHLAEAIGVKPGTLHKTPDAPSVQDALAPFANVLAMLGQVYDGDVREIRGWLETPQRELGGKTPREALLTPGGARGVEQFVTRAWLGDPT